MESLRSRPRDPNRSWKNAGDRRQLGWSAFPVLDVVGFGRPGPLSHFPLAGFFGVQAAGGWSGRYRLRRKNTLEAPPVWVAAGFRSDLPGIAITGIAKKRAARVANPNRHSDGWPDRISGRGTRKNACHGCRGVVG